MSCHKNSRMTPITSVTPESETRLCNSASSIVLLTATLLLVLLSSPANANAQFLLQSNLGRLVQSIASSPPVLGLPHASASMSSFDSDSPMARGGPPFGGPSPDEFEEPSASSYGPTQSGNNIDNYHKESNNQASYGTGPVTARQFVRQPATPSVGQPVNSQHQLLPAPSQRRGSPQRYHPRESNSQKLTNNNNRYYGNNDNTNNNDDYEPRQHSPSNTRQSHEGYQMGAYLGPSMDDKELNGVFNSNNDERDDVDSGPDAGYDEGASEMGGSGSGGLQKQQSAQQLQNYGPSDDGADFAPFNGNKNYNNHRERSSNNPGLSGNDEESADEDEGAEGSPASSNHDYPRRPVPVLNGAGRLMNQNRPVAAAAANNLGVKEGRKMIAATTATNTNANQQYNDNQINYNLNNDNYHDGNRADATSLGNSGDDSDDQERRVLTGAASGYQGGPMMAAANGYAPFGYGASGPVDLGSMLAGLTGGQNNQGYQVYQGDGSNPYPGQDYYNQQGNNNNGRQQQLARQTSSRGNYNNNMNNGYFPQLNGYGNPQQQPNEQQYNNNDHGYSGPRSAANGANKRGKESRDSEDNENEADED